MLSYQKTQGTKVTRCDLCSSHRHVEWMCANCDKIICEKCSKVHKLKGVKFRNHRILRIQGAVEVVISKSTSPEKASNHVIEEEEEEEEVDEHTDEVEETAANDETMKGNRKLPPRHRHMVAQRGNKEEKRKDRSEDEIPIEKLKESLALEDLLVRKPGKEPFRKLGDIPMLGFNEQPQEKDPRNDNDLLNEWKSKGTSVANRETTKSSKDVDMMNFRLMVAKVKIFWWRRKSAF